MGERRPTNILASYLVWLRDGQVLLAKRKNTGYWDDHYGVPAGHVEPGETFTQALLREIDEEIGVELHPDDVRVAHILHRRGENGSERVEAFFVTERDGDAINREPEKCAELVWCPIAALPENTIPYVRLALEQIARGISYSEEGW